MTTIATTDPYADDLAVVRAAPRFANIAEARAEGFIPAQPYDDGTVRVCLTDVVGNPYTGETGKWIWTNRPADYRALAAYVMNESPEGEDIIVREDGATAGPVIHARWSPGDLTASLRDDSGTEVATGAWCSRKQRGAIEILTIGLRRVLAGRGPGCGWSPTA